MQIAQGHQRLLVRCAGQPELLELRELRLVGPAVTKEHVVNQHIALGVEDSALAFLNQ
jgi:hypothetical protein